MNNYKKTLSSVIAILLLLLSCTKDDEYSDLQDFIMDKGAFIYEINGFYIVSSNEASENIDNFPSVEAEVIFNDAVKLFSNFLDQNEDGVIDNDQLSQALAQHLMFVIGPRDFVDEITESNYLSDNNIYGMAMFTDEWPYNKNYNGKDFTIQNLNSSTWRPASMSALWEEVFHTITEGFNRFDNSFGFETGNTLRDLMNQDIDNGTYDISVQNQEENGNYDEVTATNEYIHQIWAIHFAGQSSKLNTYQSQALDFMIQKGVPMNLNVDYSQTIGSRIK